MSKAVSRHHPPSRANICAPQAPDSPIVADDLSALSRSLSELDQLLEPIKAALPALDLKPKDVRRNLEKLRKVQRLVSRSKPTLAEHHTLGPLISRTSLDVILRLAITSMQVAGEHNLINGNQPTFPGVKAQKGEAFAKACAQTFAPEIDSILDPLRNLERALHAYLKRFKEVEAQFRRYACLRTCSYSVPPNEISRSLVQKIKRITDLLRISPDHLANWDYHNPAALVEVLVKEFTEHKSMLRDLENLRSSLESGIREGMEKYTQREAHLAAKAAERARKYRLGLTDLPAKIEVFPAPGSRADKIMQFAVLAEKALSQSGDSETDVAKRRAQIIWEDIGASGRSRIEKTLANLLEREKIGRNDSDQAIHLVRILRSSNSIDSNEAQDGEESLLHELALSELGLSVLDAHGFEDRLFELHEFLCWELRALGLEAHTFALIFRDDPQIINRPRDALRNRLHELGARIHRAERRGLKVTAFQRLSELELTL